MKKNDIQLTRDFTGHVLIVDDDHKNRQLLGDLLEMQGHTIDVVDDGESALERVREKRPDVILLDIMMPGIDGFEVCRQLKQDPDTAAISILIVSALSERSDRLKGIEAGANDFLVKPVDSRDVMLRVRNAIHMKALYDQLDESYNELQRLESLRDRLTNMIVHDMKAPLGGIAGYLELLGMDASNLTDDQEEYIREARDATSRLLRMIESLLAISRLQQNEMPIDLRPCDLKQLAERSAGEVDSLTRDKNITLSLPVTAATIECDKDLIGRVVINLLENAIRYAPRDSEITIRMTKEPDKARMSIHDSGPGIPEEHHDRIFEVFGQVELREEKKLYSIGLGLAFCKLAVEQHGGQIGVDSVEGEGSTFWFELPVTPGKHANKEQAEEGESSD